MQDVRDKCFLPRAIAHGLQDSGGRKESEGTLEKERPQADPARVKACRRLEKRPGPRVHGTLPVSRKVAWEQRLDSGIPRTWAVSPSPENSRSKMTF